MCLTERLHDLAARCRLAAPHPAHLSARSGHREGWLDLLAAELDDIARRVALIEAQPVPHLPAGGNVVSLDRRRADRARRTAP